MFKKLAKLITFCFCVSQGFAQLPSTTFTTASSLSKGGIIATSAGAGSIFLNHSGLSSIHSFSLSVSAERRFGLSDLNSINFSAAKRLDENSVIAVGVGSYGLDALQQQLFLISYGRSLSEKLELSVAFDLARIDAEEFGSRNQIVVEVGSQYRLNNSISLGLIIKNPISNSINESLNTGSLIALGGIFALDEKVNLYADIIRNDWDRWDVRAGLSYQLHERLELSLGTSSGSNTINFGFRFNIQDNLSVDFAASRHRTLGISPSIGVVFDK